MKFDTREEYNAYYRQHDKLRRSRGGSYKYKCIKCGKRAQTWAHRYGTDREDVNNYDPMCSSCHAIMDKYYARKERCKKAGVKFI